MSGKIEISRELLARTYWELDAGTPSIATLAELQAILAAPVVERQPSLYRVLTPRVTVRGEVTEWFPDYMLYSQDQLDTISGPYKITESFYTSPPAPVAADIAHDRAYRNGLMAGFQFGISGNEKGYAVAIANFNSEIHAAKGKVPAPVAVQLDENVEFEKWWCRTPVLRKSRIQVAQEAWEARARLDKVKELNQ